MLLLGPGGSAVEYDLSTLDAGCYHVSLELLLLGAEREVAMQGHILIDGKAAGDIPFARSTGEDETRAFDFRIELDAEASRMRIENSAEGMYLRLKRIRISGEGDDQDA